MSKKREMSWGEVRKRAAATTAKFHQSFNFHCRSLEDMTPDERKAIEAQYGAPIMSNVSRYMALVKKLSKAQRMRSESLENKIRDNMESLWLKMNARDRKSTEKLLKEGP